MRALKSLSGCPLNHKGAYSVPEMRHEIRDHGSRPRPVVGRILDLLLRDRGLGVENTWPCNRDLGGHWGIVPDCGIGSVGLGRRGRGSALRLGIIGGSGLSPLGAFATVFRHSRHHHARPLRAANCRWNHFSEAPPRPCRVTAKRRAEGSRALRDRRRRLFLALHLLSLQ